MASKRPKTVAAYIQAAPRAGQPHLRRLRAILRRAAPKGAKEVIKWGTPFFIEPRFVFAYSAHKAHLSLAPTAEALAAFRKELAKHDTTKYFLKVPYGEPLPEALIRRIARRRVQDLRKRKDGAFW